MVHDAAPHGDHAPPRAGVPRLPARRVRTIVGRAARLRRRRDPAGQRARPGRGRRIAALIAGAERPAFIVGSDVYWAGAWDALRGVRRARCACRASSTGSAGAACPPTTSSRSSARAGVLKERADLVVVLGTPLDFRLGFGRFGAAQVAHVVDARQPAGRARRRCRRRRATRGHARRPRRVPGRPARPRRLDRRAARRRDRGAQRRTRRCSAADGDPIKPSRIYGELGKRLEQDAVVICDGGDFASYAGKFVEVFEPGCWLDTGPYGCLGNGPGYAIAARVARPSTRSSRCSATARPASA